MLSPFLLCKLLKIARGSSSLCRACCGKTAVNQFANRTHTCGELRLANSGESVTLRGWLQYSRMGKFIVLYDAYGSTQVMIPRTLAAASKSDLKSASLESVLRISGTVQPRPESQRNPAMPTGDVEVIAQDCEVLNKCDKSKMPVSPGLEHVDETEAFKMKYRYLDLRQKRLQRNIRFRSKIVHAIRRFLIERCEFVEIETPTLFRRTPGGAAEFIVPSSQEKGHFYSLPQSPQQFKQLLMIGGFDRYFQIARCYRDEFITSERQPEFTQLDLELAFSDSIQIRKLVEAIIVESWPSNVKIDLYVRDDKPFPAMPDIPFKELTYRNAMNCYGTDKPDLRFNSPIIDLKECVDPALFGDIIKGFLTSENDVDIGQYSFAAFMLKGIGSIFGRDNLEKLTPYMKQRPFTTSYDLVIAESGHNDESFQPRGSTPTLKNLVIRMLKLEKGDIAVIAWGRTRPDVWQTLGALRFKVAEAVDKLMPGSVYTGDPFAFVWVTDFPLFTRSRETGRLESNHHPFTAPIPAHRQLVETDPEAVIGQHYDLVLNGVELGGGSIRIHDAVLQRYVVERVLGVDPEELELLLKALSHGAPPHGGFALGLDRYLAMLCSADSIKDVIAFPKALSGRDTMAKSPSLIPQEVLDRYGLLLNQNLIAKGDYK